MIRTAYMISWFLSLLVIFLLPIDLTSTAYRQCILDFQNKTTNGTNNLTTTSTTQITPEISTSHISLESNFLNNNVTTLPPSNNSATNSTSLCIKPWNFIEDDILRKMWRLVYWSSQFLTWLVLPLMQSYSMVGDFTTAEKFRSAVKANLKYYSIFGGIFIGMFVYLIFRTGFDLSNIKLIIITSSNTWGLFLLVILLGYGLIELPRSSFNKSLYSQSLNELYFKVAKVNADKCEAEARLDDVLEEIHKACAVIHEQHHLRPFLDIVLKRCPVSWRDRSIQFRREPNVSGDEQYDLASMTRLNTRIKFAVHYHQLIISRWTSILIEVFEWEDVLENQNNSAKAFVNTIPKVKNPVKIISVLKDNFYSPKVEWYWRCVIKIWLYRFSSFILGSFSITVVWSEITFLFRSPVLSIFALFINGFQQVQDYFLMELFSLIVIGYLAMCAYYTISNMKTFNQYILTSYRSSEDYNLIFCGMLMCRLAVPLCLNFLCLTQKDSHLIRRFGLETSFTAIMGHLDLIPFVNDGLNIILPLCIGVICVSLYFNVGTFMLHKLGFDLYIEGDDITTDYVQTGRNFVKREKTKMIRNLESSANFSEILDDTEVVVT